MFKVPHNDPVRLGLWLKANEIDPDKLDYGHDIYTNEGVIYCRVWRDPDAIIPDTTHWVKRISKSVHHRTPLIVRWE